MARTAPAPGPHVSDLPEFAEVDALIHDLEARLRALEGYYGERGEFSDGAGRPLPMAGDAQSFRRVQEFERQRLATVVPGAIPRAIEALAINPTGCPATPAPDDEARALLAGKWNPAQDEHRAKLDTSVQRMQAEATAARHLLGKLSVKRERIREQLRAHEVQHDPRALQADELWRAALESVRAAVQAEDALLDDLAQRGFGRQEERRVPWLHRAALAH